MRQAIVTKYLGPTDSRGSRVKATAQAGSITVPWDYSIDADLNHYAAAMALVRKLNWSHVGSKLVGGALPNGHCFVFVCQADLRGVN